MKLTCVRLNKDCYIYAAGRSLSGTIPGPAEVIGPWVKVSVPSPTGEQVEVLIWGAHTLPSEVLNEQQIAMDEHTRIAFDPLMTQSISDILGEK